MKSSVRIFQASLRSEEFCQDSFKVFLHVVVHGHFYFSSISLVITIRLSHPQVIKYYCKENDYINYLPTGISIILEISYEASFKGKEASSLKFAVFGQAGD